MTHDTDRPTPGPVRSSNSPALAAPATHSDRPPAVALLMTPATYRSAAFLGAAERLGLSVVRVLDLPDPLTEYWHVELGVDFTRLDHATGTLTALLRDRPVDAILALDDSGTLLAARVSAALGLPHNDPSSALAARDKHVMRQALAAAGVPVPGFTRYPGQTDPATIAGAITYPVVVKPLRLSGSRGVIRADDPAGFIAAWTRTHRMLVADGHSPADFDLLVEEYLPGIEVAVEGLLTNGALRILALFDKPDPLDGPFFEETIYVTPSRLPAETQALIARRTAEAAAALGLREGPIHAELRIDERDAWPIELAGRSIGGLCSSVLEFGAGLGLEELILRHAVGLDLPRTEPNERPGQPREAAGVMMIPIPKPGLLTAVHGQDDARSVPGVTGIEITAKLNHPILPLPEGSSYLGFIFARAPTPAAAEAALRAAHAHLRIEIKPTISLSVAS